MTRMTAIALAIGMATGAEAPAMAQAAGPDPIRLTLAQSIQLACRQALAQHMLAVEQLRQAVASR